MGYFLLRILERGGQTKGLGVCANSGDYGDPIDWKTWLAQLLVWILIVMIYKFVLILSHFYLSSASGGFVLGTNGASSAISNTGTDRCHDCHSTSHECMGKLPLSPFLSLLCTLSVCLFVCLSVSLSLSLSLDLSLSLSLCLSLHFSLSLSLLSAIYIELRLFAMLFRFF